ncbi:hypothetical protein GQX74_004616 [Glossina fuscipes]|nr:hypothetical protein GQX74_004616 [Glossina fuscipes]
MQKVRFHPAQCTLHSYSLASTSCLARTNYRDYGNPDVSKWMEATITQQLKPRSYCCVLIESQKNPNQILNNQQVSGSLARSQMLYRLQQRPVLRGVSDMFI